MLHYHFVSHSLIILTLSVFLLLYPRHAVFCSAEVLPVKVSPPSSVTHAGWPSCDPRVLQSSGYLDIPGVNGTKKHFFFWLFGPRRATASGEGTPVILWLTGGPGCSSGIGLGLENGPCLTDEQSKTLKYNPYGWNDEAYLLYIDQPIGTGYSYSESERNVERNEEEVGEDMYQVLQQFARTFSEPSISERNPFFIIGESYAGHYVPAIANRVVLGNQLQQGLPIRLEGIAIGNGWTNPLIQYESYAGFAYFSCLQALGRPCVNEKSYQLMVSLKPTCVERTQRCWADTGKAKKESCAVAQEVCLEIPHLYSETGLNPYDIRKPCVGRLCYPMDYTLSFFDSPEVKAALGVHPGVHWEPCSSAVHELFTTDWQSNYDYLIPVLLDAKVRVLVYAGDMDFICNYVGNLNWVKSLAWPGQQDFVAAPDNEFKVGERWAGTERRAGLLSFVRIYGAGHMVPMDQPEVSLYMLHRFLHAESMLK